MTEEKPLKEQPKLSTHGEREAARRAAKSAAALRQNLQKRKAQTRGRAEADDPRKSDGS